MILIGIPNNVHKKLKIFESQEIKMFETIFIACNNKHFSQTKPYLADTLLTKICKTVSRGNRNVAINTANWQQHPQCRWVYLKYFFCRIYTNFKHKLLIPFESDIFRRFLKSDNFLKWLNSKILFCSVYVFFWNICVPQ